MTRVNSLITTAPLNGGVVVIAIDHREEVRHD
jgi:hypothetical protein